MQTVPPEPLTLAPTADQPSSVNPRGPVLRSLILLALGVWAFWPELTYVAAKAQHNSDWSHALAAPVVILALLYRRRRCLAEGLTRGSPWGIAAMLAGFALLAVTTWPFNFRYAQQLAVLPVLAGVVLAAGGWRVLKHCLPMLLVVFLSVPVGQRMYASLIIRPETYTLSATRVALDQLPDVEVELEGPDLYFSGSEGTGAIALGEPRRGATLVMAYLTLGAFVVFAQVRPLWRVAVMAVAAVPIALFCNFLRLCTWGIATIYRGCGPTSAAPRAVAAIVSLLAAYIIFALLCAALSIVVLEAPEDDPDPGPQEEANA